MALSAAAKLDNARNRRRWHSSRSKQICLTRADRHRARVSQAYLDSRLGRRDLTKLYGPSSVSPTLPDFSTMTVPALRSYAADNNIRLTSRMTRKTIVEVIEETMAERK